VASDGEQRWVTGCRAEWGMHMKGGKKGGGALVMPTCEDRATTARGR
jgi:hypothetical protein